MEHSAGIFTNTNTNTLIDAFCSISTINQYTKLPQVIMSHPVKAESTSPFIKVEEESPPPTEMDEAMSSTSIKDEPMTPIPQHTMPQAAFPLPFPRPLQPSPRRRSVVLPPWGGQRHEWYALPTVPLPALVQDPLPQVTITQPNMSIHNISPRAAMGYPEGPMPDPIPAPLPQPAALRMVPYKTIPLREIWARWRSEKVECSRSNTTIKCGFSISGSKRINYGHGMSSLAAVGRSEILTSSDSTDVVPSVEPPPDDPYRFSHPSYWMESHKPIVENDEFHDLLVAAVDLRARGNSSLAEAICDAELVTDSLSMVQLFQLANLVETIPLNTDNLNYPPWSLAYQYTPQITTSFVVQHVNGKMFLRAYRHPVTSSFVKTDAAGDIVPPRYRFCPAGEGHGAQSFKRVSTFRLSNRRPGHGHDLMGCNILIQDCHLVAPGPWSIATPCQSDICVGHGGTDQHAVPMAVQGAVSDRPRGVWASIDYGRMMPRLYFANCMRAALFTHRHFPQQQGESPGFEGRPIIQAVTYQALEKWQRQVNGILQCLVLLLDVIREETRDLAAGHDTVVGAHVVALPEVADNGDAHYVHALRIGPLLDSELLVSMADSRTVANLLGPNHPRLVTHRPLGL